MKKKELLRMIEDLRGEIELLKSKVALLNPIITNPTITPSPLHQFNLECVDLYGHDYPNPWGATTPPTCRKCGKQSQPYYVTYGTVNGTSFLQEQQFQNGTLCYQGVRENNGNHSQSSSSIPSISGFKPRPPLPTIITDLKTKTGL